jgi:hypothetical protein
MTDACITVDVANLVLMKDTINTCLVALVDEPALMSMSIGSALYLCISNFVNEVCGFCLRDVYDEFRRCFIDTCNLSMDTPNGTQLGQDCDDCLQNFRNMYFYDFRLCNVHVDYFPGHSGNYGEMIAALTPAWPYLPSPYPTTSYPSSDPGSDTANSTGSYTGSYNDSYTDSYTSFYTGKEDTTAGEVAVDTTKSANTSVRSITIAAFVFAIVMFS